MFFYNFSPSKAYLDFVGLVRNVIELVVGPIIIVKCTAVHFLKVRVKILPALCGKRKVLTLEKKFDELLSSVK